MVWLKNWPKCRESSLTIVVIVFGLLPATWLPAAAQSFVPMLDMSPASIKRELLQADFVGFPASEPGGLLTRSRFDFLSTPSILGAGEEGNEIRIVTALHGVDNLLFTTWMSAADKSSYPLMFGSLPAWWVAALASESVTTREAVGFSGAWFATAGSTFLLKRISKRARPYVSNPLLGDRLSTGQRRGLGDYSSFPSGHSSLAAVSASYWILRKRPPIAGPAAAFWAVSMGVSRIWKGVHYPTDVIAGFILGSAAAVVADAIQ